MTRQVNKALELLADAIRERRRKRDEKAGSRRPVPDDRPANAKRRRGRVSKVARKLSVQAALIATLVLGGTFPALAAEGDLDEGFADQGIAQVEVSPANNEHVFSLGIGNGGTIYGGVGEERGHILALESDGTLHDSYGTDGIALVHPNWNLTPRSIVVDGAGRLVLAGRSFGVPIADINNAWVARLDETGSNDTSFDGDGHLFISTMEGARFRSAWTDPQGRIVAVGAQQEAGEFEALAARFLENGDPDPSFGDNGLATIPGVATTLTVFGAPDPAGGVLLTGRTTGAGPNNTDYFVIRLLGDGTFDQDFGTVTIDFGPTQRSLAGIAVTPTGRIVIAGYTNPSTMAVARLLPSGDLDLSLQGTGKVIIADFGGTYPLGLAVDDVGRMILAGEAPESGFVARLRSNGNLDQEFGSGGVTMLPVPGWLSAVAIQSDGKIVAGGTTQGATAQASLVARFEASIPNITFTDDDDSVFENAIEKLAQHQITMGCNPPDNTRYCPGSLITRGQMAAFLVRGIGYTDDGGGGRFTDTTGHTFQTAIDRLSTAGVTEGCNPPRNTEFCPDDFVTRGQMAAFLVRALGYGDDGGGDLFVDDDDSIFERAIDRLGTAGVTLGCNPPDNDRFCPNDPVTRGQMAAFLARAFGLP